MWVFYLVLFSTLENKSIHSGSSSFLLDPYIQLLMLMLEDATLRVLFEPCAMSDMRLSSIKSFKSRTSLDKSRIFLSLLTVCYPWFARSIFSVLH